MKDKNNLEPSDYLSSVSNTCNQTEIGQKSALEALKMVDFADVHIGGNATMPFYKTKQYRIIEETLNDYNRILKDYITLKTIFDLIEEYNCLNYSIEEVMKRGKALEIIKAKNVDLCSVKECVNVHAYNDYKFFTESKLVKRENLTKAEFDLLKEVSK